MWCLRLLLLVVLLPWSSSVKREHTPAGTPLITEWFGEASSAPADAVTSATPTSPLPPCRLIDETDELPATETPATPLLPGSNLAVLPPRRRKRTSAKRTMISTARLVRVPPRRRSRTSAKRTMISTARLVRVTPSRRSRTSAKRTLSSTAGRSRRFARFGHFLKFMKMARCGVPLK